MRSELLRAEEGTSPNYDRVSTEIRGTRERAKRQSAEVRDRCERLTRPVRRPGNEGDDVIAKRERERERVILPGWNLRQIDNRARYRAHNASRDAVRQPGVRREPRRVRRREQTVIAEFPFQRCFVSLYAAGLGGEQRAF